MSDMDLIADARAAMDYSDDTGWFWVGRLADALEAAEGDVAALEEALTEECRQLARTTIHTAAAMGTMRLTMGEEMVKLGYSGLREKLTQAEAERDAALAAIERVRATHQKRGASWPHKGGVYVCGADNGVWPCSTIAVLDRLTVRKAAPAEAFCIEHGNFHAVELGDPTCEFEDGFGEPVDGEKP